MNTKKTIKNISIAYIAISILHFFVISIFNSKTNFNQLITNSVNLIVVITTLSFSIAFFVYVSHLYKQIKKDEVIQIETGFEIAALFWMFEIIFELVTFALSLVNKNTNMGVIQNLFNVDNKTMKTILIVHDFLSVAMILSAISALTIFFTFRKSYEIFENNDFLFQFIFIKTQKAISKIIVKIFKIKTKENINTNIQNIKFNKGIFIVPMDNIELNVFGIQMDILKQRKKGLTPPNTTFIF